MDIWGVSRVPTERLGMEFAGIAGSTRVVGLRTHRSSGVEGMPGAGAAPRPRGLHCSAVGRPLGRRGERTPRNARGDRRAWKPHVLHVRFCGRIPRDQPHRRMQPGLRRRPRRPLPGWLDRVRSPRSLPCIMENAEWRLDSGPTPPHRSAFLFVDGGAVSRRPPVPLQGSGTPLQSG